MGRFMLSVVGVCVCAMLYGGDGGSGVSCGGGSSLREGEVTELLPLGDMEEWCTRYITESRLLGGKTKELYVLAPRDTLVGNVPFDYGCTSWGISNAYANVVGIAKAACTTQPERREGGGWCARLDTRIETVRVLGMVDIEVCIAGTLFLGAVREPVRSANDPYGTIDMGVPFTRRPKALMLDIRARVDSVREVVKALGFGRSVIEGHDEPEVYVYLQRRWEDEDGRIYAERVGTARHRFAVSIEEWWNDYRVDIHYGDVRGRSFTGSIWGCFLRGGSLRLRIRGGGW